MNIEMLHKIKKDRYITYFRAKYNEAISKKDRSAQVYYKYQIDKELEYLNVKKK